MFFLGLHTVNEIKAKYRELAKQHHPDIGGDTATMQKINAEYLEALKRCDGQTSTGTDNKQHTYHYNEETEQEIMDKINAILSIKMDEVEVWLIGTWIWIDGNTKPHREALKELGCKWHGKRKKWYWAKKSFKRRYNPTASFDDLAATYGATTFKSQKESSLAVS